MGILGSQVVRVFLELGQGFFRSQGTFIRRGGPDLICFTNIEHLTLRRIFVSVVWISRFGGRLYRHKLRNLNRPAGELGIERHPDGVQAHLGRLGHLGFQRALQQIRVPVRSIIAAAQGFEYGVEFAVVAALAPDPSGRPLLGSDPPDLMLAQSGLQGLGDQRQQSLHGIGHAGNQALVDTIARFLEFGIQLRLGEILDPQFPGQEAPGVLNRPCLIGEGQVAAEIVFPEMGQHHIGLTRPGLENTRHPGEPHLPCFLEQFLEDLETRVPAGVNDVVRGFGPLSDHQRLIQAVMPNRILDPVVFGIRAVPGIALVALDAGNVDNQGC